MCLLRIQDRPRFEATWWWVHPPLSLLLLHGVPFIKIGNKLLCTDPGIILPEITAMKRLFLPLILILFSLTSFGQSDARTLIEEGIVLHDRGLFEDAIKK